MIRRLTLGLIFVLLLAACRGEKKTDVPTETVEPTKEALPEVTLSPTTKTVTATSTESLLSATTTITPTIGTSQFLQPITSGATLTPTPVAFGPGNFPQDVNPLTGLVITDTKLLERRPIAIKVNIVPRRNTRPSWGLSFADIVYDYYHNDGYSRFHAIYYGQDAELVGPIRSGRLLDHELIRMYQSIFAYGSADKRINDRFFNAEYSNRLVLEGTTIYCPPTATIPLCRFDPSGNDHLLGSTALLSQYATDRLMDNKKQNLNGMTFNSTTPADGEDGSQLFVRYSGDNYTRWDYEADTGMYLRFQDDVFDQGQGESYAPLIDRLNNQQITAANVVVIMVPHVYFAQPPGEIVEILLSGTGKAYAFRDGEMYEVTWNRPGLNTVLYLTFPDGTSYPFKPGSTWVQVLSDTSLVIPNDDGVWRFNFRFP